MVTVVNHKVIECDICKECKEFASSLIAPNGWEKIHFSLEGLTYLNVDVCPDCAANVLDSDEFIIADGDKIQCVRLYMGETLDPWMDREVSRVRAYDGGFDIDIVVQ